jgi:hypothetical protein
MAAPRIDSQDPEMCQKIRRILLSPQQQSQQDAERAATATTNATECNITHTTTHYYSLFHPRLERLILLSHLI